MSNALLVAGELVPVAGVTIVSPLEQPWCYLAMGKDGKPRTRRPQQIILHKTIADAPEHVLVELAGPAGGAEKTARYWQQSDGKTLPYRNAGAHITTGEDGIVACLCDLVTVEVFHATVSNAYSIGIETREHADGGVYKASLDATIAVVLAICEHAGIQLQVPKKPYNGHPLKRMLNGGYDVVGVLGHRDNTEDRGHWDPGDLLFKMLVDAGAEQFDVDAGEDLATWRARQTALVAKGHKLIVDGVPGPATTAALKLEGYRGGVWSFGRA